ncbi:MAG: pilus assembly protein PilM, partial [Nitrospiraceae bacterium]
LLDKIFGTYLGIEFKEDSLVITRLKNNVSGLALQSSSSFPLRYGESVSDEVREYINEHGRDVQKVFVSIPDRWAITKFLEVPSMRGRGQGALADLMKFEIERHIPFEIDDVAYDFMVMEGRDKRTSVVFVTVKHEKIEFVKDYLEKIAIRPHAITISSFAVLNSIELGGLTAGGWQDIIGIIRKSDVLGKKGETNMVVYIEADCIVVAVIRDGLCSHLRSMVLPASQAPEESLIEMSKYLAEVQSSLSLDQFDKVLLAGGASSHDTAKNELNRMITEGMIHAKRVQHFSGKLKGLEMNGLSPSIGACFGGLGIGTYRINLLPHKTDYEIRKIAPLAAKVFLAVICLLLVAIVTTGTIKQKRYLERMDAAMEQNEPQVKELEVLLAEINAVKEESGFLSGVKRNEITLEILSELAALLPKDAWITNLQYTGFDLDDRKNAESELVINGYAASSSSLIPLLEDSPLFEKVEFVGPIKKTGDSEQFKLSAKVIRPADRESEGK